MKIALIVAGVVITLLVVLGAVAVVALPDDFMSSFNNKPQGTEVRLEAVTDGTLVETVSAPGEIEPLTKVEITCCGPNTPATLSSSA